jgi:hypothetical protein
MNSIERVSYSITQYVKESKKTMKSVEKSPIYIHEAVEMADGEAEKINYLV